MCILYHSRCASGRLFHFLLSTYTSHVQIMCFPFQNTFCQAPTLMHTHKNFKQPKPSKPHIFLFVLKSISFLLSIQNICPGLTFLNVHLNNILQIKHFMVHWTQSRGKNTVMIHKFQHELKILIYLHFNTIFQFWNLDRLIDFSYIKRNLMLIRISKF